MKNWKLLFYLFSLIPFLFITSLLMFYFKAGKVLGRMPYYNNPDPQELEIYDDYAPIIDFTAEFWLCSLLIWFVLIFLYVIVYGKKSELIPIIVCGISQLFGFSLLFSDVFEWYID